MKILGGSMKKIFIILVVVLVMIGCEQIKEGKVIEKWYEEENTFVSLVPVVNVIGKTRLTTMMPMINYDDEDFVIKIEQYDKKTRDIYLTKDTYTKINIGDWFIVDKDICETTDEHITKSQK